MANNGSNDNKPDNKPGNYVPGGRVRWVCEEFVSAATGQTVLLFNLPDMPNVTVACADTQEFMAWLHVVVNRVLPHGMGVHLVANELVAEAEAEEEAEEEAPAVNVFPMTRKAVD